MSYLQSLMLVLRDSHYLYGGKMHDIQQVVCMYDRAYQLYVADVGCPI